MKKALVIIMMLTMILSLAPAIYAEPDTTVTDQEDPTIPPTDGYKFGMTVDNIHEMLGFPDDKGDSKVLDEDIYYDVNYFALAGHLLFTYDDNQVHGIYWESPKETMTDEQIRTVIDAVEKYYDEKVGTAEDQKTIMENPDVGITIYSWSDEFNKTDYSLQITTIDGITQIYIGKSKSLAAMLGNSSETDKDADQIAADILEALNNASK